MGPERHLPCTSSEHRHYSAVLYKEVPRHGAPEVKRNDILMYESVRI